MIVGICPSGTKREALQYVKPIYQFLKDRDVQVYVDKEAETDLDIPYIEEDTPIDVFITIGGDGTLLHYNHRYQLHENAMFTAVNLGRLGFMADVQIEDMEEYLTDLIQGDFDVEERIVLQVNRPGDEPYHCINDLVLHRGDIPNMINLRVKINGDSFTDFQSDGLIISTPTGSSAYSLAAGGPLIHPTLHAFVMTPICPHTLTSRPVVIPASSEIEVEYLASSRPIEATCDGICRFAINPDEAIFAKLSPRTFRFITFKKRTNYYAALRSRLRWKGAND